MKTTASNGTVLEVGKTYTATDWKKNEYIKMLAIGKKIIFVEKFESNGDCYETSLALYSDWIPYKEPQAKPFEGYQKWYCVYNGIRIVYAEIKPIMHTGDCYSESEIIELGLKI